MKKTKKEKASDNAARIVALRLALEALSCAVLCAHRARQHSHWVTPPSKKALEAAHNKLVKTTMLLAGELSDLLVNPEKS